MSEELVFKSKIIKANSSKGSNNVFMVVGLLLIAFLGFAALNNYEYATIAFVLAVVAVIGIAVIKKGNIATQVVSNETILITPETITIGDQRFSVKDISNLFLRLHSYNGMNIRWEVGQMGTPANGMNNEISFDYLGKKEQYHFYLANRKHAIALCAVLREYYRAKIPVTEIDFAGRRTCLMQLLETKEEIEQFKRRHKIP